MTKKEFQLLLITIAVPWWLLTIALVLFLP